MIYSVPHATTHDHLTNLAGRSKPRWPGQFWANNALPISTKRCCWMAGAKLNLAKTTAKRLLDDLRGRIVQTAEALYAEVEAENAGLVAQRPELAATLAGESRCLRAIVHVVIKDMAAKLM